MTRFDAPDTLRRRLLGAGTSAAALDRKSVV